MKKTVLAILLVIVLAILSGCEFMRVKTEVNQEEKTVKKTITLFPDL